MKIRFTHIAILIALQSIFVGCGSTGRLYNQEDEKRVSSGKLDDSTYNSLRQLLSTSGGQALNDTIIIKYDYQGDDCWNLLDQREATYIQGFIANANARIESQQTLRRGISVFRFREPGRNVNKIIGLNKAIMVNSSKQILAHAFKQRSICGSSMLLLPDKSFIYMRSDSHFELLDLLPEKIGSYLSSK